MNLDTQNSLDALRVTTQEFLDQQKVSAARIVTVELNTQPVQLIAYKYYGDTDRTRELINLNKDVNVPYYEGSIEVLTDDNG